MENNENEEIDMVNYRYRYLINLENLIIMYTYFIKHEKEGNQFEKELWGSLIHKYKDKYNISTETDNKAYKAALNNIENYI